METRAIRVHAIGGPDVLSWESMELGAPGEGEVLLGQRAVGLNFIDVYHRSGVYPAPDGLPFTPGGEASGVVESVGPGVTDIAVGDRVAYGVGAPGAYAERRIAPADRLVKVPDTIDDSTAAAIMLKGMTVQYLLRQTHRVERGETILFHAAAGGVGLIACQWAKHLGATVIGTVSTDEKAEIAKAHGCDHPIVYTREDFSTRVRELTDGRGVPVAYDSVGNTTFSKTVECVSRRGLVVCFGQASGLVEPIDVRLLSNMGSLYLTRPTLGDYAAGREELLAMAGEVFDLVGSGTIKLDVMQSYQLRDAADAHRDLEGRKTRGATVLIP